MVVVLPVIFNIGKFIIEGKHTYYMFNPIMGPEFSWYSAHQESVDC